MPSRRRSSSTQDSSDNSITRPTDGAGHGLRHTRAIVSSAYVIRDVPQSMRQSDISTDASDISNTRDRRAMLSNYRSKSLGATRMVASERLKQKRRNSGFERGGGDLINEIDIAESYNRDEKEKECRTKTSASQQWKQGKRNSGSKEGQGDAPANITESNIAHPDGTKEENIGLNQSTKEILSDYIQLKLELAELQSKLQFTEADAKIKIEALQAQNEVLGRNNASLIERNKELQEENERLNQGRWFGRNRRISLPERVNSVSTNQSNSCMLGSHSEHQEITVSRQVASKHQSSPKEVKLNQASSHSETSKSPASASEKTIHKRDAAPKTTSIANDHELYKQITLYRKQQSMERSPTPELKITQSKQRNQSHTSTSDTSCESSSVHQQTRYRLSRSPIGDHLCFSIQPESVTSDYCEFSVIEPV